MRIRQIKPGFWKNVGLGEVSRDARLLFAGLWSMADCAGRMPDQPKRIKVEIFPYDTDLSPDNIDAFLNELSQHEEKFIERYEVEGKRFIQVSKFSEHQHLMGNEAKAISTYPPPESNKQENSVKISTYSVPTNTPELRSNGSTEERTNGHVRVSECAFQKKALEYAQKCASNSPNFQNVSWIGPYLEIAFLETLGRYPNIDNQGILQCWRDACDASFDKSKGPNYLKTTFLNRIQEWKPGTTPAPEVLVAKADRLLSAKRIKHRWDPDQIIETSQIERGSLGDLWLNGDPLNESDYEPMEETA